MYHIVYGAGIEGYDRDSDGARVVACQRAGE